MRNINEIIVHCSYSPITMDIGVETIRQWHLERGFKDVGYHYIIRLDGSIEIGRSIDKIGAHCLGRNAHTVGICYIGGMSKDKSWADTRTPEQIKSLESLVNSLKTVIPTITEISGHNEYSDKACPCFNVKEEFSNKSNT